jgi:hypothetical protein
MLEGLIQAYLEGFLAGWRPRCELHQNFRDSPSGRTALSSCSSNQGETRHVAAIDFGKRSGHRAFGLRQH